MNGANAGSAVAGDPSESSLRLPQRQLLLGWTLGLSVLFTFIGRSDDAGEPLIGVVLFWLLHVGVGLTFCCALTRWLQRFTWLTGRPWLLVGLAGLLAALCFAPVALLLEVFFARFGIGVDDLEPLDAMVLPRALLSEFGSLAPSFGTSWLLLMSVYRQVNSERHPEVNPKPEVPLQGEATGLTALLPIAMGSELWHIAADLNYLQVRTSQGQAMVLYSLARAAEELGDSGLLVHRSHWVAISAVRCVRRQRQGLVIELLDSTQVPVARRRQAQVRALFGDRFVRSDSDFN